MFTTQTDCQEGSALIEYLALQPPMMEMPKMGTSCTPVYEASGEPWAQPTPPIWTPQPTNRQFHSLAPIGYVTPFYKCPGYGIDQSEGEVQQ